MPADRAKIIAALNEEFKGKSVSKNYKEKLATLWADKIADDDGIGEYLEDRKDIILEAAKDKDSSVSTAVQKARQEAADAVTGTKKTDDPAQPVDDPEMPAWAKALMTQQQQIAEKVNGFESARSAESIAERFKKDERLKGVPEFLLKRAIPQKEEDFEAAVTELATEYKTFATEHKLAAFGGDKPAAGAAGAAGGSNKEASKEDLDAVVNHFKI
jgi:hypothetical protein